MCIVLQKREKEKSKLGILFQLCEIPCVYLINKSSNDTKYYKYVSLSKIHTDSCCYQSNSRKLISKRSVSIRSYLKCSNLDLEMSYNFAASFDLYHTEDVDKSTH